MGNRHCLENKFFGELECCFSKDANKNRLKETFVQELSSHHKKDDKDLDELRFQNFEEYCNNSQLTQTEPKRSSKLLDRRSKNSSNLQILTKIEKMGK